MMLIIAAHCFAGEGFVHPGLLTSQADITFIKVKLAAKAQPWQGAMEHLVARKDMYLQRVPKAAKDYHDDVTHWYSPSVSRDLLDDGEAAYGNVLLWLFTGDQAHALKAIVILDAWAGMEQVSSPGKKDLLLQFSYGFPMQCWAGELLIHGGAPWPKAAQDKHKAMLRTHVLPRMRNHKFSNNWASWSILCHMTMGVYLDDRGEFDAAVARFREFMPRYLRDNGIVSEMSRDLDHAQMGLGPLAVCAEIGWKQGLDLWALNDNRIMHNYEGSVGWFAGTETGKPPFGRVKWTETGTKANKLRPDGFPAMHERMWPIYEIAYNHYVNRRGLAMPNTKSAMEPRRPELFWRLGWGTLLHAGDSAGPTPQPPVKK